MLKQYIVYALHCNLPREYMMSDNTRIKNKTL